MNKSKEEAGHEEILAFKVGSAVLFREFGSEVDTKGTVLECPEAGKVLVEFPDGRSFRINRCYLRPA